MAKLNSQTANAMEVVRAQQAAKERGAFELLVLSLALHRDHVQVPTKRLPPAHHLAFSVALLAQAHQYQA